MSFMGMLTPIKLGVRFEPPAIILVYRERGKLRRRVIPTKNIDILTEVHVYAENFKKESKYRKYFDRVSVQKIEKIVFILQDNMKGYNLSESLERAKKYDDSKADESEISESEDLLKKKSLIDDYDDDDFHDTEDEDDKNVLSKSVSTLEEVKAAAKQKESTVSDSLEIDELIGTLNLSNPTDKKIETSKQDSKLDALSLLSNQMKTVKSSIYDFEDEVESESEQDDSSILNKFNKKTDVIEEEIETANHSDSDESF